MIFLTLSICFFLLFYAILEYAKRHWYISTGITRKIAHIFSACAALSLSAYLSQEHFLLATVFFLFFFLYSSRKNFLSAIHNTTHKTYGEIFYPIALLYLGFFFYDNLFIFATSILVLGIADALPAIYDLRHKRKTHKGRLVFWFLTLLIIVTSASLMLPFSLLEITIKALMIATIATLVENYSSRGSDNITVPITISLLLVYLF